jgi:hypothetical protein
MVSQSNALVLILLHSLNLPSEWSALLRGQGKELTKNTRPVKLPPPGTLFQALIITHKFLEPPVERGAKAEVIRWLFNATWLATMARKNVPKDMGNDKFQAAGLAAGCGKEKGMSRWRNHCMCSSL